MHRGSKKQKRRKNTNGREVCVRWVVGRRMKWVHFELAPSKIQTSKLVREPRLDGSRPGHRCDRSRTGSSPRQIRVRERWRLGQVRIVIRSRRNSIESMSDQVREVSLKWGLSRRLSFVRALHHPNPGTKETRRR
jgi:hypothetical protein